MQPSYSKIDLSIVLPVYFNEENLRDVMEKIDGDVIAADPERRCEVIFVDDGSGDRSFEVLRALQKERPGVIRIIKLTRNFGQVSALLAGFAHARGEYVAAISADGQDPPRLIDTMYRTHLDSGHDIVICHREERDESLYRSLTSKLFYWLMAKLSFPNMPSGGFDFVSFSRRALQVLLQNTEAHGFLQGQILWMGFTPKFIPYRREQRSAGRSRWTFRRKLTYLIDGVLSFSYAPIRIMSLVGGGFALLGLVYAALIIFLRLTGEIPIKGWSPIMVVVLVSSGVQMMMIGIVGEYMWRTLAQSRNRDLYIIDAVYE